MLFLAKLAAIAVVVWFYLAAQKHKEPPIKWAVIGFVGYVLVWFLVYKTFVHVLPDSMTRTAVMGFIVMQVPAFCAVAAAYLIRLKLISDAINSAKEIQPEVE